MRPVYVISPKLASIPIDAILPLKPVYKWVPVIDKERCTGCGLCVEACGPKSLALHNDKACLVYPDTCGSEEHCIAPCPEHAIYMAWVPTRGNHHVGKWAQEIT